MTPDAASTQPRKRSWKRLIVALACVVAVTIIALLAKAPRKEPVTVRFVRSTNEMGIKKLISPYGLTETHIGGTVCEMDDPLELRMTTVGRPMPGVEI